MIDEQDLFGYIFFPENLSVEKKKIIETDKTFEEILEFYRHLKENALEKAGDSLRKKLADKIPAYSLLNVIRLYPLKNQKVQTKNRNRLAAASKELTPKMTTKTFVDNEKDYLIKVLNYGEATKIFVFSTNDDIVKNFDIIIEPQNLKFHFDDNSEPLKINQMIDAEKIQISFSK